jgi:hypothetical protein
MSVDESERDDEASSFAVYSAGRTDAEREDAYNITLEDPINEQTLFDRLKELF